MNMREQATEWLDKANRFYIAEIRDSERTAIAYAQVYATLHLADMQREHNKLIALTAKHQGLDMTGFGHLLEESD